MFGQDEQTQRVQALVEKKAQLEAALPVVDDNRAMQIEARLDKIEAQLAREVARAQAIGNVAALRAAMGVDGTGGLEFQAQSPAGVGRLIRLPFYPTTASAGAQGYTTLGGAGLASAFSPIISPTVNATGNAANTLVGSKAQIVLTTPQISWATLRIVGFEVDDSTILKANPAESATVGAGSAFMPKLTVSDLQIGGGANLFTHEDFGDGNIYSSTSSEFCGLRDYPLLKSPNTASVTVALVGVVEFGNVIKNPYSFSCSLICEVLQDDNYGSHIPGPYARAGAMVRRGGSFVS